MQERKDTMLSIRSMIERFRVMKPTSRHEREQAREQQKELRVPRPVRDEEGSAEKDVRHNSFQGGPRRLMDRRQDKNVRWADSDPRSVAERDADTDNPYLSVEKLMSQDIQRFIAAGSDRSNRSPKPPRVAPSIAPMSQPTHAVMEGYSRSSLVLPLDRERAPRRDSKKITRGEEKHFELSLRDSLALDPNVYTGSAELRGGGVTPASPQQGKPDMEAQQLNPAPNENAVAVNVFSAADIAADLDGVLKQLRNGTIHGQSVDPPGHLSPRECPPVNLAQIAHDLDAKLLEFTLMAKARERVAEEAHSAAEAEKNAWREGETKRVENEVRQEHAMLHSAAKREDFVLPMAKGGSEAIDFVSSRGHMPDWDSLSLRNMPTRHPALPPSALGGCMSHFSVRADAPVDVVTNQMACILRAVEAKVRRIEALEFGGSRELENEESHNPRGCKVEETKSPPGKLDSSCTMEEGDEIAEDMNGECMKEANMDGHQTPMVSPAERNKLVAELDDTFTVEGGTEVDPNIGDGQMPGRLFFPSDVPVFPNVIHQSWLNGQTTLQQAGQCIGAELEVAMMCMQKRLGKQPIVYGEEGVAVKVANQDDPAESTIVSPTEEPQEKAESATVGGKSEISLQENLQALADDMEARREQNSHTEVDRELGLVFRNDLDFAWCDHDSAIDRRHRHYGGREQDNGATLHPGKAVGVEETIPASSRYLFHPQHAIWGVPVGEPPLSHTQALAEKEVIGIHVPPVLAPSDGVIVRPASLTPEQHLVPPQKANRSRLLAGRVARVGGVGNLEEKFQQLSSGMHQHRNDDDGSGFAVTRARDRLNSFRAARQSISTNVNSDHGHEHVPSQVSADQYAKLISQDGAKAMLDRLKEMRCSVLV